MTPICAIKDLERLGRPLEKTLIIDNRRQNFDRQPDNGIKCSTWTGNPNDRQLIIFKNFLEKVVSDNPSDIRPHIAAFKRAFGK